MTQQDLYATVEAKSTAIQVLDRARNRPNFGNGGEVENLLTKAKGLYHSRVNSQRLSSSFPVHQRPKNVVFEPHDFDPQFDRVNRSSETLEGLLEDIVGCDGIKEKLRQYQRIASTVDMDTAKRLIPTNFVFKGPPGDSRSV